MIKIWYFIATLILAGPVHPDGLPRTSTRAFHFDDRATCEQIREFFGEFAMREPEKYYRWSVECLQVEMEEIEEEDREPGREKPRTTPVPGNSA